MEYLEKLEYYNLLTLVLRGEFELHVLYRVRKILGGKKTGQLYMSVPARRGGGKLGMLWIGKI